MHSLVSFYLIVKKERRLLIDNLFQDASTRFDQDRIIRPALGLVSGVAAISSGEMF